jgi:L-alanine-DL-glutamate epimerase-like enolase superfamily enzyme
MALKRSTRIPILTGEKLELVRGFRPFLDNQGLDIAHPDLAFAGGFTGTKKIADYAALTRTPVALHNVGSIVLCYANAHFGASIQNFYRSESALGRANRYVENMVTSNAPVVQKSQLKVPEGPGLGLDFNWEFLKKNLAPGEEFWG